jgi:hypothetical protein
LKQNSLLPVGSILPIATILGIENGRADHIGHNEDRVRSGLLDVLAVRSTMFVGRFGKELGDRTSDRAGPSELGSIGAFFMRRSFAASLSHGPDRYNLLSQSLGSFCAL